MRILGRVLCASGTCLARTEAERRLNDKLDYMLDHLAAYTDNDIISIVDQMDELYPADPTPPVLIEESLKDF